MSMHLHLPYAEFYITNVCNLDCTNCNRFNNFNFSGHSYWKDHESAYKQWANLMQIDSISILGGEPMLNPDFMSWLENINKLWPSSTIRIVTNGTQLHRHPGLYEFITNHADKITIAIDFHGYAQKEKVTEKLKSWLGEIVTQEVFHNEYTTELWQQNWNRVKDPSWPDCNDPRDFVNLPICIQQECINDHHLSLSIWENDICVTEYRDINNVVVSTLMSNYFMNSTLIFDPESNRVFLNDSNPESALKVCYSKTCHEFINGQLYKCGPAALLPEFIRQFDVDIADSDRELINSYVPANVNWDADRLSAFINDLKETKVIPQCKFCPETLTPRKFEAGGKKIKLLKLIQ